MALTSEDMNQRQTASCTDTSHPGAGDAEAEADGDLAKAPETSTSPVRPARRRQANTNSATTPTHPDFSDTVATATSKSKRPYDVDVPYKSKWRYPDLLAQIFIHAGGLYGFYLAFTQAKLMTILWVLGSVYISAVGVTAGAHRLWSHKAYHANLPLRILLALIFTMSGQRHIWAWVLDHRVHHKFTETDADPHDARRGFLFAHIGWLVVTPHPAVEKERLLVDMSDLAADPVVAWHKRLYVPLFALFCVALPVGVPNYFWNESLWVAFWVCFNARFSLILNLAFLVNSAAHMYGNRPYDMRISSTENAALSVAVLGEGWHNYHHVFPWDYRAGELGQGRINITTNFIDFMARIGWVKNRRKASPDMIIRHAALRGDGTARHDERNLAAAAS